MNCTSKNNNASTCRPVKLGEAAQCDVCLAEVPLSVAKSVEGLDYVHYFCGLDCMAKWLEQAKRGRVTAATQ